VTDVSIISHGCYGQKRVLSAQLMAEREAVPWKEGHGDMVGFLIGYLCGLLVGGITFYRFVRDTDMVKDK